MQQNEANIQKQREPSPKETMLSVLKTTVVTAVIIAFAALVLSILHIGCPIKFFTGLSCPGCGMFRAWTAALTLQPLVALAYHPLFWCVPIALVAAAFLQAGKYKKACTAIIVVLLALIIAVWLARLFTYPDLELFLSVPESAQHSADIVGWSTPKWIEVISGVVQA